jgi:hypothetical protein
MNECIHHDPEYEKLSSLSQMCEYFFSYISIADIEIAYNFRRDQITDEVFNAYWKSLYSMDYDPETGHKSTICAYNRIEKLRAVNKYKKSEVEAIKYPYRIEFRYSSSRKCKYLNPSNLHGTAEDIANRFFFLSVYYKEEYFPNCPSIRNFDEDKDDEYGVMMLFYYMWTFNRIEKDGLLMTTRNYKKSLLPRLWEERSYHERMIAYEDNSDDYIDDDE